MKSETDRRSTSAGTRAPSKPKRSSKAIENEEGSKSDAAQLQRLLENFDLRFVNCTFTYRDAHLIATPNVPKRKKSTLARLSNKISQTLDRVREAVALDKTFEGCMFFPVEEEDKIKDFIHGNFSEAKLSFVNCKFIKRNSSIIEQVNRRLRKVFGIIFELEYINSSATIQRSTFRMKDILLVYQHIQERIVEEG